MQEWVGKFCLILTFKSLECKISINPNEAAYPIIIMFMRYNVLICWMKIFKMSNEFLKHCLFCFLMNIALKNKQTTINKQKQKESRLQYMPWRWSNYYYYYFHLSLKKLSELHKTIGRITNAASFMLIGGRTPPLWGDEERKKENFLPLQGWC